MKDGILPFDRDGGWTNAYHLHYRSALFFRDAFLVSLDHLRMKEDSLYTMDEPTGDDHCYVIDETGAERAACLREGAACLLFSCMAIEGFLNYYGVRRLGEPFFKQNVERIGITEKLAVIVAVGTQKRIEEEDDVRKSIRWIFDERNALIHPKTKDLANHSIEAIISKYPSEIPVAKYTETLESFLTFMQSIDPSIRDEEVR